MPITITCSSCAAKLKVGKKMRGRKLFCPKCGKPIEIASNAPTKPTEVQPVPPELPAPRNWNRLVLFVLAILIVLPGAWLLTPLFRGHPDEPTPIAKIEIPPIEPPTPTPKLVPKPVAIPKPVTSGNGHKIVESILDEIKRFPPMKKSQYQELQNLKSSELPPFGNSIDDYSDDGFNPFTANAPALSKMKNKSKYPLRVMSYEIAGALKKYTDLATRDVVNSPLDAKAKIRIHAEQKEPAMAILALQELLDDTQNLAANRDKEKSKRWQAHFDLAMTRLQARLVSIYEYNNLLALVRSDNLPALQPSQNGWRATACDKVRTKEAVVKDMAKQIGKNWEQIAKDHPNTPWAFIAEREKNTPFGLEWTPMKK